MPKPRSVEIYLKEGIPEDDYIYTVSRRLVRLGKGRRQAVFRQALRLGLGIMFPPGGFEKSTDNEPLVRKPGRPSRSWRQGDVQMAKPDTPSELGCDKTEDDIAPATVKPQSTERGEVTREEPEATRVPSTETMKKTHRLGRLM